MSFMSCSFGRSGEVQKYLARIKLRTYASNARRLHPSEVPLRPNDPGNSQMRQLILHELANSSIQCQAKSAANS